MMRVFAWRAARHQPSGEAVRTSDTFAALGVGGGTALGGFRILTSQRPRRRPQRTRLYRLGGLVSLMFAAGIGVAAIAGPAACACAPDPSIEAKSELSKRFVDRSGRAGTAGISTAALPGLGAAKADPFEHAGEKPLRLAALTDIGSNALPEVLIETPALPEVLATDAETSATAPPRAKRKNVVRHRAHTKRPRAARKADTAQNIQAARRRAPKWAQQMYDNPWQSKAFAYSR